MDQPGLTWLVPALAIVAIVIIIRQRWHRLDHLPQERPTLPPAALLGMAMLMLLLGSAGASATATLIAAHAQPSDDPHQALILQCKLTLGAAAGQALAALLAWQLARLAALQRALAQRRLMAPDATADALRSESPTAATEPASPDASSAASTAAPATVPSLHVAPLRAIGIGIVGMVIVYPIVATMGILAAMVHEHWTGTVVDPIAHETLSQLREAPRDGWFVLAITLALIAAPLLEEILYRGLLQPAFRGALGLRWPAIAITSLCFAAMHLGAVEPSALPVLFTLSLALGWARERTAGLLAPITMHALFNAVNLTLAL